MTRGDAEKVFFDAQHAKTTDRGGEVEMVDNDRHMHTTGPGGPGGPDGKEVAETMTLTKIDDMWLTEDQLPMKTGAEEAGLNRGSPGLVERQHRWPNRILYYRLTGWFATWQRQRIEQTLQRLEQRIGSNCVKFRRSNRWDAVQIRQGDDCSAIVGYVRSRNQQRMSLGRGCWRRGTIMHEFLHSLGIHHTQNRWDRDRYVHINEWNVYPQEAKPNFWKQPKWRADSFGLPYDYYSVMHYHGSAFAYYKNYPTIVTKDRRYQDRIGQRDGLSEGDVRLIRQMYQCN